MSIFAGCVIEGFGGGHVTREVAAPGRIERLIDAMSVAFATRIHHRCRNHPARS